MIVKKFLLAFFLTALLPTPVMPQAQKPVRYFTGLSYAGTRVNRVYLPPPKEFFSKTDSKGGAEINVTYSNFPLTARNSVDFAISILQTMLPAGTKINVLATWKRINERGVLGNSAITGLIPGWVINAPKPWSAYPLPLAEKILGESINTETTPDIDIEINSSVNWYYGTDGNTPVYQYDLVTVVLHEMLHGLGFFDSMDVTDDKSAGYYGIGGYPLIYDTFVENVTGSRLTDTLAFENFSPELYSALTGNQLYFSGPLLNFYLSGGRAKLYAPATWDLGSSVSHLDEYTTLQVNSLITPFIDLGEAIHDPGRLIMSILGDMGWIHTTISHDPPGDTEEPVSGITISAAVSSDTVFNRDRVRLVYSTDGFTSSATLLMTAQDERSNIFSAMVPVSGYNTRLEYFIYTEDIFSRIFRAPALAPEEAFSTYIGTDTVKPVIVHTPATHFFSMTDSLAFSASVTDNIGVDTVFAEYSFGEGEWKRLGLGHNEGDVFRNLLSISVEDINLADSLRYRIIASDKANDPNFRFSPAEGYYAVSIENIAAPADRYSTNFSDAEADFYLEGFTIGDFNGFPDRALHSEHPYASPEEDGKEFEFSAVLRTPVRYDPSGLIIAFGEVVMVEPGEEGALFGTDDFYDYVVVEASADNGKTWFAVADGYDSGYKSDWLSAYNSNIDSETGNSLYEPSASEIVDHVISADLTGIVEPYTPLLIRFRLYSDPYANGWGWMIDNLVINPLYESAEEHNEDSFSYYPNPGNGIINLVIPQSWAGNEVKYSIWNTSGTLVVMNMTADPSAPVIDISGLKQGVYYIKIESGTRIAVLKYTLVR